MTDPTAQEQDQADWSRHPSRISQWNRGRKWRLFEREMSIDPQVRILDVGFSENEKRIGDNYLEKHYPHPAMITALGIDAPREFTRRYPEVKAVTYDGSIFPFEDDSFDIVWSNAVLEHVGDRADQLRFLQEIRRVGKRAFVTTPNRFFPIEVHTKTPFLHYLPPPAFDAFLRKTGKDWATGDYMTLLSGRQLRKLLDEAGYGDYRLVRNRLGGFTLDFVVLASF